MKNGTDPALKTLIQSSSKCEGAGTCTGMRCHCVTRRTKKCEKFGLKRYEATRRFLCAHVHMDTVTWGTQYAHICKPQGKREDGFRGGTAAENNQIMQVLRKKHEIFGHPTRTPQDQPHPTPNSLNGDIPDRINDDRNNLIYNIPPAAR